MSTVIGLGEEGCALANVFKNYPQYNVYNVLVGNKRTLGKTKYIKEQKSPEDYEANCPSFKNFFKAAKGDVLFVLDASDISSAASLRILSYIKNCNISILYLRTQTSSLSEQASLNEAVVYGVLQEYARSAVFEKMIIIDIPTVASALSNLTVASYHERIRETIVSTLHMLEVYTHTKPVLSNFSSPNEASRLLTVGIVDMATGKENLFFPLDFAREKWYYYAINKDKLDKDSELLGKIEAQAAVTTHDNLKTSYGIYSTEYEQDYVFAIARSSAIQK